MSSATRYMHHDTSRDRDDEAQKALSTDIQLFSPESLRTEPGLRAARNALNALLKHNKLESLHLMVETLLAGPPNLLEYVIAVVVDESKYGRLLSMLQQTFPSSATAFSSSLARNLIERLRVFYLCSLSSDLPRTLDKCHRDFEAGLKALDALDNLKFGSSKPSLPKSGPALITSITPKQSHKQAKRNFNQSSLTDSEPFAAIGKSIPSTKEQADELVAEILHEQRQLLEEYLTVLRSPQMVSHLEALYLLAPCRPESLKASKPSKIMSPKIPKPKPEAASKLETDVHPAYPQIQPLKAAKYFAEPAEGFGPWGLLLSSRAIQHLKGYHRDGKVWDIIKKKMQELSEGFFSDSNQKLLSGNAKDIPIYEAKLSRDLRIIYQIDIAPEDGTRNDVQVIRLWGIHTHAQMDQRLWKSISQHHTSIGSEYRRRCLYRATPKQPGKKVIMPYSWPTAVPKIPTEPVAVTSISTDEQLELHSILALEKFTKMSQELLNNIIADQDAAHPFELTGAEQEIRDHSSSCFVLGRSGTGKTTTMIFKMMNYEMLKMQQATQGTGALPIRNLRQLFITQSRILVGRVQEYFTKMKLSHTTGRKDPQELERLAQCNQSIKKGGEMPDLDDGEEERTDLPKKFSELEDGHFPLFLTVDQLCKLLEADCSLSFKRRPRTKEHRRAELRSYTAIVVDRDMDIVDNEDDLSTDAVTNSSIAEEVGQKASIVTYDVFRYAYWPRFPEPLTKGLDPGLVYNEFIGVIKGSEETLEDGNDNNFLEKQAYLSLSERRQATFSRQRERIYELFEYYRKLKGERGDYDAADRTHAILRALQGKMSFKWKVDYLYVDEAQDNLIIDAQLLRLLCGNPHGFFWAGDTAQTISMGSSFRFDDLKSFIYRIEEKASAIRAPVHPASFQLDINYRSHAGVVNCAHSIVELITKFWPYSIDSLARERGLVDGPRPVFFSGWDPETASYEQFLFHESLHIELGAQQCILVRNDQAREKLRRQIGEVGLVMTLHEAKGLEFNDVLLYDFFADSISALSEWRVVLNAVEHDKRENISAPRFDESRHALLCSELKSLYVGITRARSHVWILDTSRKGEPMSVFWQSQGLIQLCRPNDPPPKLAVKSTPEQWAQQGHALFRTNHFNHAMLCFDRAALPFERSVAHAYLLRQTAHRLNLQHDNKASSTISACLRAAESFVVCAGVSSSLVKRTKYLTLAADLFSRGSQISRAAQAYFNAGKYTEAAQHFMRAELYEEAADVVLSFRSEMDSKVAMRCLGSAKLYLHREGELLKASRLFNSMEEHLEYLDGFGFDDARVTLLQHLERWVEAAELLYDQERHYEAIPLWLRAGDLGSKRRASQCLLDSLWKALPLGAHSDIDHDLRDTFLEHLKTLDEHLDEAQREESVAFSAILSNNPTKLIDLARASHRSPRSNPMVALRCLDHLLRQPPRMQNDDATSVSRYLEDYHTYGRLMRAVVIDWKKTQATALLGLVEIVDESNVGLQEYRVLSTSVLHEHSRNEASSDENDVVIGADRLSEIIRLVLGQRMQRRLEDEHNVCLHTRAFRPCIHAAVTGYCSRPTCPCDHIPRESLDVESFNLRIRLHMQQILIVHNMGINYERGWKLKRIWLERLHETVFPKLHRLGHVPAIIEGSIPEYQEATHVLKDWVCERFYHIHPYHESAEVKFLTEVIQTVSLGFTFHRDHAAYYTRRADCIVKYRPPLLVEGQEYLLHDLINFFEAKSEPGSSPESSVIRGAKFIKHVLDKRIPIDIDTVLNITESVFARAIIASRHSIHDLTLPRSWILKWLPTWNGDCADNYDTTVLRMLSVPLGELIEAIGLKQGIEHFDYDRRSLSYASFIARSILCYRICKCVTLVGYNTRSSQYEIKSTILRMMKSMRHASSLYSPLVAQYTKAEQWSDLSRAVRSSMDSPIDELVVMQKTEKIPTNFHLPRGLKLQRYNAESDILTALAYKDVSKFNPEAAPFVLSTRHVSLPIPEEGMSDDGSDGSEVDESPNETVQDVKVSPNDPSVHVTEEEIKAAKDIHSWYRRRLAIKSKARSEIVQIRSLMYAKSQTQIDKLGVPRHYRHMFLGPLPHILTALNGCQIAIQKAKKDYKKRLLNAKPFKVDKENELMTTCNHLQQTQKRLWKTVEPTSQFHYRGSCLDLKERVEDINDLFGKISRNISSLAEFAWDLEVGCKGIVQAAAPPRPTVKTVGKPSLNTEDLDL